MEGKFDNNDGSVYFLPEEMPDPNNNVRLFAEALETVRTGGVATIDMDDVVGQAMERPHKSLSQSCIDVITEQVDNADQTSLYVHDSEIGKELDGLNQLLISRTTIGETSAHQVFFAVLTDGQRKVRVAVKPFVKEPHKAITEWSNTQLANRSQLTTFPPIGFIMTGNRGFVLTERQDGVESMDNVNWASALQNPELNQEMLEDIVKIGPALARLHDMGWYHGDTQLKNIVITQSGSVHLIDWEASAFLPQSMLRADDSQSDFIRQKTTKDLKVLFSSMARDVAHKGVGLLHGYRPSAQVSYFNDLILKSYVDTRLQLIYQHPGKYSDAAIDHVGEVEEAVTQYIQSGDLYISLSRSRMH